jgi:hypothetical protein
MRGVSYVVVERRRRGGEAVAGKWEKLTSSVTACGREGDRVVMPVLGGEEVGSVGTWSL